MLKLFFLYLSKEIYNFCIMEPNKIEIAIEALKERKQELLEEVRSIDNSIRALGGSWEKGIPLVSDKTTNKSVDKDYKADWSIKKKFAYLLKKHNRFLHFREAAEMINSLENRDYDISELATKLSSGTQSLKSDGTLVKVKINNSNRSTFWGYKDWIDEKGGVIKGYEFNDSYVFNPGDDKEDLFSDI